MSRKADAPFDPSQPTLIVTYGNTARKHRPLDRDVLAIGQHRSCDLGLVSPEIAAVHCLVIHGSEGWRVRDCGSRIGTRLNGKPVQETLLCDGDTLQIGPFSFQAHLPPETASRPEKGTGSVRLEVPSPFRAVAEVSATSATTSSSEQGEILSDRLRDCEQREARLEEGERNLASDRTRLDQEIAAFREQVERSKTTAKESRPMEMRQQELNHFAQHLHRAGLALKLEEDRLTAERDQQARQRGLIEQAEAGLQKQRDELARMMAELHALHQTVRDREEAALQLLRRENAQLRQSLDMSVADSCQLATSGRET